MSEKEVKIVNYFINNPDAYISEIASITDIPRSTVQRYLQKNGDKKTINGNSISTQLEINKARGNRKGGEQSFSENEFTKDASGKFTGSVKTDSTIDKIEKKEKDIKLISKYYLENKDLSLEEIASLFNDVDLYTKSYVYDCLTSNRAREVLGEDTYQEIQNNLKKHRPNNIGIGNK